MLENLKIRTESKKGLEWLKENYSFTTYSVAIDTVIQFFKNNNINPRETIYNNYSETIYNFKKELFLKLEGIEKKENDNTERVIKLNRRIEEDLIKPIRKNVYEIHSVAIDYHNTKSNENLIKNIIEEDNKTLNESSNLDKIKELEKVISDQDAIMKKTNSIIEEQDKKMIEYHRCLKKLNDNVGFEKGFSGKKVFIDLPFDEVQELFYLIP
jgi:hypothetical protein